ncbi:hypothetical protein BOTCAL_0031g00290 [Botryotinia calthae]|uniref:Uncharacterized protein n=1 Tax=Botryotinia calthae TaxID=38488 RepID=A0A4Y8DFK8_9HELO|nr:hypothetical protein BOTCAL_0031g00290 [Botryotinia calthae]
MSNPSQETTNHIDSIQARPQSLFYIFHPTQGMQANMIVMSKYLYEKTTFPTSSCTSFWGISLPNTDPKRRKKFKTLKDV